MKKLVYLICLSLLVIAAGCRKKNDKKEPPMKTITAVQLKEKMEKNPNLMVVNVLSKESYDDCHIKGSINIPTEQLDKESAEWDKNQEIVIYCASYACKASANAYKVLKSLGFINVVAYEGGMKEWLEKKFDVEGICLSGYLK